ncbi:MAG: cysteine--tRNA ligase, partial [Prochlorococcaceae cyanobacterium]
AVLGLRAEPLSAVGGSHAGSTGAASPSETEIEALIEQRRDAKASRDFATADGIRAELKQQGIELIDKPGGITEWLRG